MPAFHLATSSLCCHSPPLKKIGNKLNKLWLCYAFQYPHLFPGKFASLDAGRDHLASSWSLTPHACTRVHLRPIHVISLSSGCQHINHTTYSSVFLSSFSLPFLSFSLMLSHSCDPVNNSFCLSSQSPFVPARKLEAVIWPLNKLQGHVVELDKNYGLRACGQEDFFWFGKLGLWASLFAFLSLSSLFWRRVGWLLSDGYNSFKK